MSLKRSGDNPDTSIPKNKSGPSRQYVAALLPIAAAAAAAL